MNPGRGPAAPAEPPTQPASERYRELIGVATEAAELMRQRDRQRAEELTSALAEASQRLTLAAEQEEQATTRVRDRWKSAMQALWHERWLSIGQLPAPTADTVTLDQEQAERELERAHAALEEALKKRPLLRRRL